MSASLSVCMTLLSIWQWFQTRRSEWYPWSSSFMARRTFSWPPTLRRKGWTFPIFNMSSTTTCRKILRTMVSCLPPFISSSKPTGWISCCRPSVCLSLCPSTFQMSRFFSHGCQLILVLCIFSYSPKGHIASIQIVFRVNFGTKISIIYINDINHDSIMIFSSENITIFLYFWYFQNINHYYYYLLTFLIHAYLTQTAQVSKLLDGAKILPKS